MKKGYLMAIVDVADSEAYKGYTLRTPGVIEKFGGRFISRGAIYKVLEGGLGNRRIVLVEFESPEMVDRFYQSEEYRAIERYRKDAAAHTELLILEGFEG
jgi:uncharacterized protein (DUF1330 family)